MEQQQTYGLFQSVKIVFTSFTNMMVSIMRTSEKSVQLVENELDNLHEEQRLRLEEAYSERLAVALEREKAAKAATRKPRAPKAKAA